METQLNQWLPLTEYALRSGMSISTLRRKIKTNTILYKMEEGRYLISGADLSEEPRMAGFVSSDDARPTAPTAKAPALTPPPLPPRANINAQVEEMQKLREEMLQMQDDNVLRWRALDARVSGLAKRLELFTEQVAELKMLVKIFEEKLDQRV